MAIEITNVLIADEFSVKLYPESGKWRIFPGEPSRYDISGGSEEFLPVEIDRSAMVTVFLSSRHLAKRGELGHFEAGRTARSGRP